MAKPVIMIYLLTAIVLPPGGNNTVHIYAQTIHRTIQNINIMIYLLTAIGLPPGGSSTVHIYTQTIHRTIEHIMIYLLTTIGLTPGGSSTVHIYTQTIHRTIQKSLLNNGFLVTWVTRGAPLCTFTTTPSCRITGGPAWSRKCACRDVPKLVRFI